MGRKGVAGMILDRLDQRIDELEDLMLTTRRDQIDREASRTLMFRWAELCRARQKLVEAVLNSKISPAKLI
jgi:hypothetical protein